ncbi:reverse transcriptase domain-containing protein [Tanacetum coccineum]
MAPKRATRSTPAATTTTTTTVTNAHLKAMIDQGVTNALAAHDADKNMNGDDSHNSGTGVRRTERVTRETVGHDVVYAMTWTYLKKKMTDKYCPRVEIKKLEVELMFPEESDKIERFAGGLPDMIHGSVVASKPKTMQEETKIATELMDKRIHTFVERTGEKKLYGGSKPLCLKSPANANTTNNLRGTGTGQKPTCYECGAQRHFKRECSKLKNNNNRGNPARNVNALVKVYAVGHAGANPDSNVVATTVI